MAELKYFNKIIVHCSDSDVPSHDDIKVIDDWHIAKGFSGCGYHFFIKKNGVIQYGRPLTKQGAHCLAKGRNGDSIGICLSGQKKSKFTIYQYDALARVLNHFVINGEEGVYKRVPVENIFGHRDFEDSKTCPNFEVKDFVSKQKERILRRDKIELITEKSSKKAAKFALKKILELVPSYYAVVIKIVFYFIWARYVVPVFRRNRNLKKREEVKNEVRSSYEQVEEDVANGKSLISSIRSNITNE